MKIAVAGTGYVGLSVALLLAQHNEVHALDIVPEKVEKLNHCESPIVDVEITRFLDGKRNGTMNLDFQATTDPAVAYTGADYAVVATPTNYDERKNYFDTSSVEAAIKAIREYDPDCWIVIKSTIPVGYTAQLREKTGDEKIIFSPSSCVKAMHYTITCTLRVSSSARRWAMPRRWRPPARSQIYWRKALHPKNMTARTPMVQPAFLN